jgi:hypothetical protein
LRCACAELIGMYDADRERIVLVHEQYDVVKAERLQRSRIHESDSLRAAKCPFRPQGQETERPLRNRRAFLAVVLVASARLSGSGSLFPE